MLPCRGALAMTLVMLVLRSALGIPTPSELIGDRLAPLIPVRSFGDLIRFAGGYNELKQLGIASVLVGQLVVGTLAGAVYGLLAAPSAAGPRSRRPTLFVAGFVVALFAASAAAPAVWGSVPTGALWPVHREPTI